MSDNHNPLIKQTESELQTALTNIWKIAQESKGQTLELLEILRSLENLHNQLRDTLFQESLPDNRQALYVLLKDIETKGGWPYIYRIKLQDLLHNLESNNSEA